MAAIDEMVRMATSRADGLRCFSLRCSMMLSYSASPMVSSPSIRRMACHSSGMSSPCRASASRRSSSGEVSPSRYLLMSCCISLFVIASFSLLVLSVLSFSLSIALNSATTSSIMRWVSWASKRSCGEPDVSSCRSILGLMSSKRCCLALCRFL